MVRIVVGFPFSMGCLNGILYLISILLAGYYSFQGQIGECIHRSVCICISDDEIQQSDVGLAEEKPYVTSLL